MLIPVVLGLALFREAFGATLAQLTMGVAWDPAEILAAWRTATTSNRWLRLRRCRRLPSGTPPPCERS